MSRGPSTATIKETNNYAGGRSGSKVEMKPGPAKSPAKNPTMGGGINRATKG